MAHYQASRFRHTSASKRWAALPRASARPLRRCASPPRLLGRRHGQRGFSLIELLVAGALGVLVSGSIYMVFIGQNKLYEFQSSVVSMNEAALRGIDVLLHDLRAIGYGDTSGSSIVVAGINSIIFRVDLDDNGTVKLLRYQKQVASDKASLVRIDVSTAGTETLVENLDVSQGLSFKYYDKDGIQINDTSSQAARNTIRRIKVSIAVRSHRLDPVTETYKIARLESEVRPRNLAPYAAP